MKRSSKPATPAHPPDRTDTADVPPAHDEWLLDESLAETFPASDPIAPARTTPAKPAQPQPANRRSGQPAT